MATEKIDIAWKTHIKDGDVYIRAAELKTALVWLERDKDISAKLVSLLTDLERRTLNPRPRFS